MTIKKMITVTEALLSLRPNSAWSMLSDDYDKLEWKDLNQSKPTKNEINDEIKRLQDIVDKEHYRVQRENEYPDFRDYLDAIVKGDQTQLQAYIDACNAVKQKYPKPSNT